jgi:hypothetical protein
MPVERVYVPGKTHIVWPVVIKEIAFSIVRNGDPPTEAVKSFPLTESTIAVLPNLAPIYPIRLLLLENPPNKRVSLI